MAKHQRMLRVAVIGSGPSGLFAAEALISQETVPVQVDLLERLPTPYGLVRYGVAPDHPTIKSVVSTLHEILQAPTLRFLGGIELGVSVTRDDLRRCYDAIIYATGAPADRNLNVPGEDLPGSISASQLVSWYNGHPDTTHRIRLSAKSVAVIGAGNVALDIGRILTRPYEDLTSTDMPVNVLQELKRNATREVHLIARRGPEHANFTSRELRELENIKSVDRVVDQASFETLFDAPLDRRSKTNVGLLRKWSEEAIASGHRRINLHFFERPVEILGTDRVEGLRLECTTVDTDGNIRGLGIFKILPAQLVVRAVGHRGVALPGVPFDANEGLVPNKAGRVTDSDGNSLKSEYVAGWLKRGATGVIGTNKVDARETVASLVADYEADRVRPRERPEIDELLRTKRVEPVTFAGWLNIDRAEIARGADEGRVRSKISDSATLNELARTAVRVPDPTTHERTTRP